MAFEAERRSDVSRRGTAPARVARPPQRSMCPHLRGPVPRDARPDRSRRLRRVRREDAAVDVSQARGRRERAARMKAAVVGGGLAGLAAALDLVDAGHAVTVLEARPTLGGAVRDPARARGRSRATARQWAAHRAGLLHGVPPFPRPDRRGQLVHPDPPGLCRCSTKTVWQRRSSRAFHHCSSTGHLSLRDGFDFPSPHCDCGLRSRNRERRLDNCSGGWAKPTRRSMRSGTSSSGRRSTSLATRPTPGEGLFTVRTALLGPRANSDLILPDEAARPDARRRGGPRARGRRARRSSRKRASRRSTSSMPTRSSSPCLRARARGFWTSPSRRSRTRRS